MIRFFLALFGCQHEDMKRDTVDGVKVFVCECGHVEPQIKRREPLKFPVTKPAHELLKAQRHRAPATVAQIRQAK